MSTSASLQNHLLVLKERHRTLDKQIKECYNRFDKDENIKVMKHQKLVLKREIKELQKKIEE